MFVYFPFNKVLTFRIVFFLLVNILIFINLIDYLNFHLKLEPLHFIFIFLFSQFGFNSLAHIHILLKNVRT